ncbi:putative integral membrane protein [Babesia bovis T2Bo]|uniref:Membrane protein, putative n=1 Tax=Babesia bovis TaxID=5865 RepID=A7AP79_BABBO|nr:putative integral membrane protein [Babesia bovis T2Bo]EDO08363.1 putative integral membrane protein [Babesia bovis T2Bo]|eukprot:XP_001611931.1 membrane protein [Babesia bovis T2Bo]
MEETGAVINVGTSLFIVLVALGIAGCIALLLNAVLTGIAGLDSYMLSTAFDHNANAILATVILGILVILHGVGYYCQYVKTPLSKCHLWLLVTGSLTVLVAASAVLMVTKGQGLGPQILGYYNTAFTATQLMALMAFGVCMCKSGCFGKSSSNARIVFYVVAGIYAAWLLAYLAACAAYAVMYNRGQGVSHAVDAQQRITQSYKRIPCVNYVLLIALTFSAYQVNFCCVPVTGTDWTFLLLFGTCAGILLSVFMHYQGGNGAFHHKMEHILTALAAIIMGFMLMYSYFKEPFAQVVPDRKYTIWDLVFILLAVVLAGITMALLIKWKGDSHRGEDWIHYTLLSAMMVCTAIELGMLHFGWARGGSSGVVWQAVMVILVLELVATLVMVVIDVCGGGSGNGYVFTVSTTVYPLLILHLLLMLANVLVCHYHMPFPGNYQLWHWSLSLWDTMLVLLVLESLVVLVMAISGVHQQYTFHGLYESGQDNRCYVVLALHAILCGTAIGIIHFKEPLSQYWSKDQLACVVLSVVSLISCLGLAYDGMKPKPGESRSEPGFYCLVVYAIITFGGALYYGFRSGLIQGSCFTKKSDAKKLQGSEEAVSSMESTVDDAEDISPEVALQQDNTDVI